MESPIKNYMNHNLEKKQIIKELIKNEVISKKKLDDSYKFLYNELSKSVYNYYYENAVIQLHSKEEDFKTKKENDINFVGDVSTEDTIAYQNELLSNKNIEKYGMFINRKPEIELIDNLNTLGNKLYKNDELHNFKFKYYVNMGKFSKGVKIKTDDGKKCIVSEEFDFYLPKELELNYEYNEMRQELFSETMNTLYLICINKKYPKYAEQTDYIKAAILHEMIEYGQRIYMASRNIMVNGKNIEILLNKDFLNKFTKLDLTPELNIVEYSLEEINSKHLYKQAINKIVEDFIEKDKQNNYKYIYQNDKLGKNDNIREDLTEEIVNNELKKALEWEIVKAYHTCRRTPKYTLHSYQKLPYRQLDICYYEETVNEKFEENVKIIKNLIKE